MAQQEYSVAQLAKLSQLTERTLRYYDQIGLLVPRRDSNGYRVYDEADVLMLERIVILRSCGMSLSDISTALSDEHVDLSVLLNRHLEILQAQEAELSRAIAATQKMVEGLKGPKNMNEEQRFEELKKNSVVRFEEEYGAEARSRYGDAVIDEANERMISMSKLAWDMKEALEQRIKDTLVRAMETDDATSPEARMLADMHAQWIRVHWGEEGYSPEAHVQLAEGYLKDPRFISYYDDACGKGATEFLCAAIKANISDSNS